jgi:hypothetical protein
MIGVACGIVAAIASHSSSATSNQIKVTAADPPEQEQKQEPRSHKMKSSKEIRKRGRPATGRFSDPVSAIRLSADIKARIDAWAAKQPDKPSRSETIRRLIELGLASKARGGPTKR